RYDYEYKRNGTANLFIAFAPLLGWRAVRVTERRTRADFAAFLRWVADDCFPRAERVVLVTDNLNIHTPGSLYEAFLPPVAPADRATGVALYPEARELAERGRGRVGRPVEAVPEPADRGGRGVAAGGGGVGGRPERAGGRGDVAVHD